jgi:excisionase family DNA binding protein
MESSPRRARSSKATITHLASVPVTVVYLTPAEAASLLRVHPKTLMRWAREDPTFPVFKMGATVRYPRERLQRWLRDREQGNRHHHHPDNGERDA